MSSKGRGDESCANVERISRFSRTVSMVRGTVSEQISVRGLETIQTDACSETEENGKWISR